MQPVRSWNQVRRPGGGGVSPPVITVPPLAVITTPGQLGVRVRLVRRPRSRPFTRLRPYILTLPAGPPVVVTDRVYRARTRPRPTTHFLAPPASLVKADIEIFTRRTRTPRVRTRPRKTHRFISPPATLVRADIEIFRRRTRTPLVRMRPRKTRSFIRSPATLVRANIEIFTWGTHAWCVRTRPRHTAKGFVASPTPEALAPPTVVGPFVIPQPRCELEFYQFLVDLYASTEFADWCTVNSGECTSWQAFANAILAGHAATPPALQTDEGQAFVDAGLIAMTLIDQCPVLTAAFTYAVNGLLVDFTNTSKLGPNGEFTDWKWTFGDGTSMTPPDSNDSWSPSHEYASPGTYVVTLSVTSPDGTDAVSKRILVFIPAPPPPPAGGGEGINIEAVIF